MRTSHTDRALKTRDKTLAALEVIKTESANAWTEFFNASEIADKTTEKALADTLYNTADKTLAIALDRLAYKCDTLTLKNGDKADAILFETDLRTDYAADMADLRLAQSYYDLTADEAADLAKELRSQIPFFPNAHL